MYPLSLHPLGLHTDQPSLASRRAVGEELAESVIDVANQEELRRWRHERNAWIEATERTIASRQGAATARAFREAARVLRPFASWQLAIPSEQTSLRSALRFITELEAGTGSLPLAAGR